MALKELPHEPRDPWGLGVLPPAPLTLPKFPGLGEAHTCTLCMVLLGSHGGRMGRRVRPVLNK